ncbi:hypothetical protein [Rhizobium leguminosarum]|uniref:hypothetical protein n=1 Tax=Rhizobium leguminosarum TaxID=384 RepID=UPI0003725D9B|nr:hypothetical protein [Rhizobium leguminosarum]
MLGIRHSSCLVYVTVICLSVASSGGAAAQDDAAGDLLKEYQSSLERHLKLKGMVPLHGGGVNYRVGDFWDPTMTHLLERTDYCFPKLTSEMRSAKDELPALHYSKEAAAGFMFGLKRLFSSSASGEYSHAVTVTFQDLVEEVVSEGDLRRALSQELCPTIVSILNKEKLTANTPVGVVVGRIYRGKRKISIVYTDAAKAVARAEEITALAGGVPVTVEVSGELKNARSIVMEDKEAVPLGFAPAFVPVRVGGINMGSGDQKLPEYAWRTFDPVENPSQAAILIELAGAVQSKWQWDAR